jgi:hypothetical protein
MNTLMTICILIFAAFVAVVCIMNRTLPLSVAETAKMSRWPLRAAWYITAMLAVVCSAPALIQSTASDDQFMAFLPLASALLCIIATYSDDTIDNILNIVGTFSYYIEAVLLVAISPALWLFVLPVGTLLYALIARDSHLRLWTTIATTATLMLYCYIV